MPACLNANRAKRSVHEPCGEEVSLPAIHCTASLPPLNCGASLRTRKMLHCCFDVPSVATMRISVPPRSGRLRKVETIPGMSPTLADMLLLAGHRVNDDGALQSDLKLYGRARRQVFLPQLLAVDDDAGPGLGVIGLIADDQLYRLALLAELDCRVSPDRRQQCYARQRRPNSD